MRHLRLNAGVRNCIRRRGCLGLGQAAAVLLWIGWLCFGGCLSGHADERSFPEYQIKAAMLCKFVEDSFWPSNAFSSSNAPIVVGILGEDPFGPELLVLKGKRLKGRDLVVRAKQRGDDLSDCQLLFISRSETDHLDSILESLKGKPILTVSEIEGFAGDGGMIRWFRLGRNVRFEYDKNAIESAGLKISPTIGTLGTPVKGRRNQR